MDKENEQVKDSSISYITFTVNIIYYAARTRLHNN